MIKNITQLLNSGFSKRWHTNPDMADKADDLAQHQWSVAMVVLYLWPDCSKKLLVEALTHDVGEFIAGDLAYDFKLNNPKITALHKEAEEEARSNIVDPQALSKEELECLKFADWLSSYSWVVRKHPDLILRKDWEEQYYYFYGESSKSSYGLLVKDLMINLRNSGIKGHTDKIDLGWKFNKGLEEYDAAS